MQRLFGAVKKTAELGFNTVNGKYCCNYIVNNTVTLVVRDGFNTVNGKYCCNPTVVWNEQIAQFEIVFQYRKR